MRFKFWVEQQEFALGPDHESLLANSYHSVWKKRHSGGKAFFHDVRRCRVYVNPRPVQGTRLGILSLCEPCQHGLQGINVGLDFLPFR